MDVIAVGAGRDGTVSLANIIQDIYNLNGLGKTAIHEYESRAFYEAYAAYALDGDAAARDRLQQLIAEFPHAAIVGNGYHMVLDWFFERYPDLKLIAIRRRDEAAHVKSLKKIATLWPEVFVGYGTTDTGVMRRYSAVQSGEMTVDQWTSLSLDDQLRWFRSEVYATVSRHRDRAASYMEVETETLDDPETRQAIADFVAFPGARAGHARRLNRSKLLDLDDFSVSGGRYALGWFRDFSLKRFESEPGYGVAHALDQFQKCAQRELASATGAGTSEAGHSFGLTLDEASEEIELFRKKLALYDKWAAGFQSAMQVEPQATTPKAVAYEAHSDVGDPAPADTLPLPPKSDARDLIEKPPEPSEQMEEQFHELARQLASPATRAAYADFMAREILPQDHHSVFWGDRMMSLDKVMGFFEDEKFTEAWAKVRGAHIYDQYDNKQSIAWRMHTLVWAARSALKLHTGDFVECGVFQGDMSFVTYHAAELKGSGRSMHLFDSFEGIDPKRSVAGEYALSANHIESSNLHYGRPGLYESVLERFALMPEVSIHKGFLPENLAGHAPESIAWLHIDLNAAKPEVETLEFLFDRVVPSGIVILDDYGWLALRAQKDAEDAFFARRGYGVLELPTGQGIVVKRPDSASVSMAVVPNNAPTAIDLERYRNVFDPVKPWSGDVPGGFTVDFLGTLTQHRFLPFNEFPESQLSTWTAETRLPTIEDGEIWFEALDWFEAARDARGSYVMVTLGANYGAQAVGAAKALRAFNPMPFKLVAVEPVPENYAWTVEHMRDNGIDGRDHWLIEQAIGDSNAPVLFPVGSPGSGAQNAYSTNEEAARKNYFEEFIRTGRAAEALSNLLINNTTGLQTNLVSGYDLPAEIKVVSATTLHDILSPFDLVDYLESDIQQSEIVVFPPFMPLLKRKVRRIHIGTHGGDVHTTLRDLFVRDGWEIVFDFAPNSRFETALGPFSTNDGVLTVRNPEL